ncbi:MAG: SDR family oxidoreductase [Sphingomonadales bacterium]|nr:SDR family oxidoreductase [Sphingomonadales bacterium]
MELEGQRVLIIGGSSGIGFAVARAALAQGALVAIASSNADRVRAAVDRLGGGEGVRLDVTDEAEVRSFFASSGVFDHIVFTAADWAQVDHNAFADIDLAAAATLFDVRFWGALAVAKHGAKCVVPGGSITLTNGMAAHRPQKGLAAASAMAGAVEHLVTGLAVELAPVRVNGVCPGAIRTEAWDELPAAFRKVQEDRLAGQLIPRVGDTAEVAEAYLYLMRGSYTTGQTLRVEGGWSLTG